ncbi:MAG: phosphatidylglycerophosphatase A, partial [Proteobacteria bacterium]|nr:phosphatidylglycerophosphatase A [Pseudomonadota bacterium]
MKKLLALFIASGGFVGYFPIAPGTMGSLLALLIIWYLKSFPWIVLVLTTMALLVIGIWAAG